MRRTFAIGGKTVFVFRSNRPGSPVIYLNTYSDERQKIYEAVQATGCPPFTLVTVSNLAWNHDMAPWDSPAAFKKGEPFIGGADNYLQLLVEEIIPRAEKELAEPPVRSYPGQKKSWLSLRCGGGLLGTLWRGYSLCTPSIGQMCSHGWGACLAPCGFLASKSTSSPTSRSAGQTAYISLWGTKRPRPAIRF